MEEGYLAGLLRWREWSICLLLLLLLLAFLCFDIPPVTQQSLTFGYQYKEKLLKFTRCNSPEIYVLKIPRLGAFWLNIADVHSTYTHNTNHFHIDSIKNQRLCSNITSNSILSDQVLTCDMCHSDQTCHYRTNSGVRFEGLTS